MWVYLSHPWGPSCPAYGGGERIELKKTRDICCGDTSNQLELRASNHAGTHFDFPLHFCKDGRDLSTYEAASFVHRDVAVLDIGWPDDNLVSVARLEAAASRCTGKESLLLLRTGAAKRRQEAVYWQAGPGIDAGVAAWLRERFPSLRCIGLDFISVTSFTRRELGRQVHRELLCDATRPLIVIEDMDLEPAAGGALAEVVALPLRIEGGDGAPCTVIGRIS